MSDSMISEEEARRAVQGALARIALLHLSFSKVLMSEFGREPGLDLVAKAIMQYGVRIKERVQKGLPDLTNLGLYDSVGQTETGEEYVKGCALARVFKEQDELEAGHMYCYVDAAKTMALDPEVKMVHITCEACGDDRCTLAFAQTTEEEQRAFASRDGSWRRVDPRLSSFG